MLDDNPLGGITYAQFFPSDWRSGCIMLNLEEEGLYIRCCAWMYDTGQAIPGNDATAAKLLHVQVQKYSKVMAALIAKNKMIRSQGVIINKRVFDEIDKYRQHKAARSEAAKRRERDRAARLERELTAAIIGDRQGTPPPTPPPTPLATPPPTPPRLVGGYYPPTPMGSMEGGSEKNNEINGTGPEPCQSSGSPLAATGKPESRIQNPREEREEEPPQPPRSETRPPPPQPSPPVDGPREGEEHAGHGVYIGGDAIRHRAFVISLSGVRLNTIATGLPADEIKTRCMAHALQWAAEIENGARPDKVLPNKIMNFLARSIMGEVNQTAVQSVRVAKAREGYQRPGVVNAEGKVETQSERLARLARDIEKSKLGVRT